MKIRNVSPLGDLDVPLLRRDVEAGEVVDVTAAQAEMLLPQNVNWEPADDDAEGIAASLGVEPYEPPADGVGPQPGDPVPSPPAEILAELTVAQLREQAREQGLPTSGTKDELVDRLTEKG